MNAVVLSAIYRLATIKEEANAKGQDTRAGPVVGDMHLGMEDHAEVRKALKLSVRGWSKEKRGRCQTFWLVLDGLEKLESEVAARTKVVLASRTGLGKILYLGSFLYRLSSLGQ